MSRIQRCRRAVRAVSCAALMLLAPSLAQASGGFQFDEQSAAGVGMAGNQTAIANDPSAVYYNPAGLGFQPGFGFLLGGNLIIARTHVEPDDITLWHPAVAPTLYASLRLGRFIALGVGSFTNFGEHFAFPRGWRGSFTGYFVDVTTVTIQPTLAIRPFSWLAVGAGFDIVPGSFDLYKLVQLGGAAGDLHAGATAVGLGGNVGLLVKLVPNYLNLGFAYRSRVDMDFTGRASLHVPVELQSEALLDHAKITLPLPHNFSIALAGFLGALELSAEVKISLWRDLQSLTLTISDPTGPAGSNSQSQTVPLDFKNTWAIRGGAQYGFLHDKLRLRLGLGYDTSPVPRATLSPLLPDSNRVVASIGVGVRWRQYSVDVGYLAAFLLRTQSTDPDLIASYGTFGQIISLSLTAKFDTVLQHHRKLNYSEPAE